MPDYQNGKIYKIYSYENDEVYYGSTCDTLSRRIVGHRTNYKKYKEGKGNYITSFKILELTSAKIELVENYPCNTKEELLQREGYYIRTYDCVNKRIAGRTQQEYKKEYYEQNKEYITEYHKKWYDENTEQVKEYYNENKEQILEHKKEYYQQNKEQILEKVKEYYQQNKEQRNEKHKEWKNKNKEHLKEYYQQNKDKINEKRRARNKQKKEQLLMLKEDIKV